MGVRDVVHTIVSEAIPFCYWEHSGSKGSEDGEDENTGSGR
jgi:hypothetical protein